jgi:hypothetical protein
MKSDVELIAEAEAILDETLAYEAARAAHQLKRHLGIDIQQINLELRPVPNDSGSYCAVCTISTLATKESADIGRTPRLTDWDGRAKPPV